MHSVEIGVLSFRPDDPQMRSVVVYRDELDFVVNPKHPLAQAEEVSIRQLGTQNFIAHNISSPQRQKVIETFKRHKTPLRMGVELPSLEAIKRFVEMGNGVALVPGLTRADGAEERRAGAGSGEGAATGAQAAAGVPAAGEPVARGGGLSEGGGGIRGGARRSLLFSSGTGRLEAGRREEKAGRPRDSSREICFHLLKLLWRVVRL
jgi:hypothetical protein